MTDTSTSERAQQAASTAAEEGRHVAGTATEEARKVASEAGQHARDLVGEAVTQVNQQVGEQSRSQRDRLVDTLKSLSDDLEQMASPGQSPDSGLAVDMAREVAGRARDLSSRLQGREPTELLDDVRRFARQRPGMFLLGAVAAGVVTGRLLRGARDGVVGAAATEQSGAAGGFDTGYATTATGYTPPLPAGEPTTSPPMPSVSPGQPTIEPPPTATAFDDEGPLGTPAAGYGERGTTPGGTPR